MALKAKKSKEEEETLEKTPDKVLAEIEKKFGKGAAMYMDSGNVVQVPSISTGSMKLDNALGVGGFPRGRIVEVYGKEMSGKTTLLLQAIASAQKEGGKAAFIDAEHALSVELAQNVGVDVSKLLVSQPDYGEQALEITDLLVRSREFSIIGVDSVAALVPKAELDGEMEDQNIGLQARLMSKAMRKLVAEIQKTNTCVIFINQVREKIGGFGFGPKSTTTGGNALKFYSSVRVEVKPIGKIKHKEEVIGNKLRIQITKNKLAPPFRMIDTELIFGKGIIKEAEILDLALEAGIVEQSGASITCGEDKLGRGRQATLKFLEENPKVLNKILKDLEKKS